MVCTARPAMPRLAKASSDEGPGFVRLSSSDPLAVRSSPSIRSKPAGKAHARSRRAPGALTLNPVGKEKRALSHLVGFALALALGVLLEGLVRRRFWLLLLRRPRGWRVRDDAPEQRQLWRREAAREGRVAVPRDRGRRGARRASS